MKSEGPAWTVKERRGNKVFSRGIWAPRGRIERITRELELERANPAYQRKLEAGRQRRAAEQAVYAGDFEAAVCIGAPRRAKKSVSVAQRVEGDLR